MEIVAVAGRDVILINVTKFPSDHPADLPLRFDFAYDNGTFSFTSSKPWYYLLTDLEAETAYTLSIQVFNSNVCVYQTDITTETDQACTLLCANGDCLLDNTLQYCWCQEGYELTQEDRSACSDIDECQRSPCPDNSTCSNTGGSYNCQCNSGFRLNNGHCEVFDACSFNPCMNGTCSVSGQTFTCTCPSSFTGQQCEIDLNSCVYNRCLNHGTCVSGKCECPTQFTGHRCQDDTNECSSRATNNCHDNATCTNEFGGYSCQCKTGYRGNGYKCYKIILLPYGDEANDDWFTGDDVYVHIRVPTGIPFEKSTYTSLFVISNGLISLGEGGWRIRYMYYPWGNGFDSVDVPLIAPFWDDFHPYYYYSYNWQSESGRVFYNVYDKTRQSLNSASESIVQEVARRVVKFGGKEDFNPTFVLKVTWNEVLMHYWRYNQGYPSTFQAIVASDGMDTYLIYNYKEDAMLWDERKRYWRSNRGLIGYTDGRFVREVESQGDYRPDQRVQNNGNGEKGQFFYHVTEALSQEDVTEARLSCVRWYVDELFSESWTPNSEPCPCTLLQALIDNRYEYSADLWVNNLNYWYYNRGFRSTDITEWRYDEARLGNCFQPRIGVGPRCCYGDNAQSFFGWWGWWGWAPLIEGPFGSRYERAQIPILDTSSSRWWWWTSIYYRDPKVFDRQYNASLDLDLVPRRQCCVDSMSSAHCNLYQEKRPAANCDFYVPPRPIFTWGDPHITTIDGILYTFNGLGEYHMVYVPGVFALQARTERAKKPDGTETDATIFTAFVAEDLAYENSGRVELELNSTNPASSVVVRVNGEIQTNLSEAEQTVNGTSMSIQVVNETVTVKFLSSTSLSVSASNSILSLQFTGGSSLRNVTRGLLGNFNDVKEDDFEFRNETTLSYESVLVTSSNEIINGTLSEAILYPFGQSWRVDQSETIFSYSSGGNYSFYNPTNAPEPPFFEILIEDIKNNPDYNTKVNTCTDEGEVSNTCLYDLLTTEDEMIAAATLQESNSAIQTTLFSANSPPTLRIMNASDVEGKNTWLVRINITSRLDLNVSDPDDENVTLSLQQQIPGVTIIGDSIEWTPTEENVAGARTNDSLKVIATDEVNSTSALTINIKLCVCRNNGSCDTDTIAEGVVETFQIVGCDCMEGYSGSNCSIFVDTCSLGACYPNVTCTNGTCGSCPNGTTGDGRNCTNIDSCESNPCEQNCESFFGGDYNCSCNPGFQVNLSDLAKCEDANECENEISPCLNASFTECINTIGSYRCDCTNGFTENGTLCVDIDECAENLDNCSKTSETCSNTQGSFFCSCKENYARVNGSCVNTLDCENNFHTCDETTENCVNSGSSYICDCKDGYHKVDGTCLDIKECASLNNCNSTTQICVEKDPGYVCELKPGYEGEGNNITDINECLEPQSCKPGYYCTNFPGGFNCISCAELSLDHQVLDVKTTSVTLLLDPAALFQSYEVWIFPSGVKQVFASFVTTVTDLNPSTTYNVSAVGVDSTYPRECLVFNPGATFETDSNVIRFGVWIQATYKDEYANLNSPESNNFTLIHEDVLKNELGLTSADNTTALNITGVNIIYLARGSVVTSGELVTDSNNISNVTIDDTQLDPSVYNNLTTIPLDIVPNAPRIISVLNATTSSILWEFENLTDAVQYDIRGKCGTTSFGVTTSQTLYTRNDVASNTICSLSVRALTKTLGKIFTRSEFSNTSTASTLPKLSNLAVTNTTHNQTTVTVSQVLRAIEYRFTVDGAGIQRTVVSKNGEAVIGNLSPTTEFTLSAVVEVRTVGNGILSSNLETILFRTDGNCPLFLDYCLNGGTCVDSQFDEPTCRCQYGYYGGQCESSSGPEAWRIAVGVVGGVLGFVLIFVIVYFCREKQLANKFKLSSFRKADETSQLYNEH
uniref:Uncharacterized protein LOC100183467 n=1 Tax=Phallusia mammillata TaxID=59560 RepID=A0A6F9DHX5_9ASCI|nr:uncharacterized protein LOC100183467 [Phallusia mammillata]